MRLKISLLIFISLCIFAMIYLYSSESKQPFLGQPKELNQGLLDQEIQNGKLLFHIDSLQKLNDSLNIEKEIFEGIHFEVQLGNFETFSLPENDSNLKRFEYATVNGINYITLGKFKDLDDAKLFIEDLKKIGVKDAYIVSKLDGEEISIRE